MSSSLNSTNLELVGHFENNKSKLQNNLFYTLPSFSYLNRPEFYCHYLLNVISHILRILKADFHSAENIARSTFAANFLFKCSN